MATRLDIEDKLNEMRFYYHRMREVIPPRNIKFKIKYYKAAYNLEQMKINNDLNFGVIYQDKEVIELYGIR